jgi:hypothetical protein
VLRKSNGKDVADLFDFIVIGAASDAKSFKKLAAKEIRRAYQFARDSLNHLEVFQELESLQESLGLEPGDPDADKTETP